MKRASSVLFLGGLISLGLTALPLSAQDRGHFSIGPGVPVTPSFPGTSVQVGNPLAGPVGNLSVGRQGHHFPRHFFLVGFKAGRTHFRLRPGAIRRRFHSAFAPVHRRSVVVLFPGVYESAPSTAPAADSPEVAPEASPRPEAPSETRPVLLVLKNGAAYLATRYWEEAGRLFFLTLDGVEAALPLEDIDLEKTVRVNAERGVDFLLPLAPRWTPVEPKPGQRHIYVPITFPSQ
jgi:hypothetical protein